MYSLARRILSRSLSLGSIKPTYVSSYYQVSNEEIKEFLTRNSLEFRETSVGFTTRVCPLCPKPHNEDRTNLFTLGFKQNSGVFHCFRCGASGSWYDFKNYMLGGSLSVDSLKSNVDVQYPSESEHATRMLNLKDNLYPDITDYLINTRGIKPDTLYKYKVGVGIQTYKDLDSEEIKQLPTVYFPMFMAKSKEAQNAFTRVKARAIHKENKHHMKMIPTGGTWGFFGLNTVPSGSKTLVITEGEYDAMAVHQSTGLPAVSLPNGASHLPVQMIPWLEQFHKIILWLDDDLAGREAAMKFSKKLGVKRCFIVHTKNSTGEGPKDANEALLQCTPDEMKDFILKSKPLVEENIITFRDLREEVYQKILRHNEESGIMSKSFEWFNQKTKGFRRGELSILTGSTGSGKTTLLSQLSLDFCRQGIPTLWGSFEIKNDILLKKLLLQYSKCDLTQNPSLFNDYADSFQEIPLYLLKFFGSTDVDKILDTMDFAVYTYDIGHIIIDNLQFMLSGQAAGYAKFDLQDTVISKFRAFATEKNVHITTVIHPKKVDDDSDLNISSVFGSAKATQEADNIFVLQNRHKYRLVDVRKNRFDGELGRIGLGFDKGTLSFFELTTQEITELRNNPDVTMKDILKMRTML